MVQGAHGRYHPTEIKSRKGISQGHNLSIAKPQRGISPVGFVMTGDGQEEPNCCSLVQLALDDQLPPVGFD